MLKTIRIRNMRGVKEATIDNLTQVNILIGRNGVGKSTLLEAVYLASSWHNLRDEIRGVDKIDYVVRRRGFRGGWKEFKQTIWFQKNVEQAIDVILKFHSGKQLSFKIPYNTEEAVWLEIPGEAFGKISGYFYHTVYYNAHTLRASDPWFRTWTTLDLDLHLKLLRTLDIERETRFLQDVVLIDSRLIISDIERNVWPKLLARRLDKLILDVVREGFEVYVEDLTFIPTPMGSFVLALKTPETVIEVDGLGDGVRNAIAVSSILASVKDTLVLVEDPEIHLHPGGLAVLMRFMLRMARERNLQLIMSTHSVELVNIARRLCEELNMDLNVYFMERGREGVVETRILKGFDVDVLQKLGLDPRLLEVL